MISWPRKDNPFDAYYYTTRIISRRFCGTSRPSARAISAPARARSRTIYSRFPTRLPQRWAFRAFRAHARARERERACRHFADVSRPRLLARAWKMSTNHLRRKEEAWSALAASFDGQQGCDGLADEFETFDVERYDRLAKWGSWLCGELAKRSFSVESSFCIDISIIYI